MAFTNQGTAGIVGTYRSCGRSFAVVDPERQREVEFTVRLPTRESLASSRVRRVPTEWFSPPRVPSEEGGSSRRDR